MNPELPSTALGTLKLMPSNLEQVSRFSKQLVQSVMDGETNPLQLLVMLRALEKTSEVVIDCIRENINSEASKFSEREIELFGARLTKGDISTTYDYTVCQDSDWEQFKVAEQTATQNRKDREAFLRTLKQPMEILDKDTGEVRTIRPPLKRSQSGVKVQLR